MEYFPGEREAKDRLRKHGIDIEVSYLEMMLLIAGAKAPEILSGAEGDPELQAPDPAWVKDEVRQAREIRDAQKEEARRLRALGRSIAQIAASIGVSEQSIRNWTR